MKSRPFFRIASLAVLATLASASAPAHSSTAAPAVKITVFKDPDCGCCKAWVDHLRKHSFDVITRDTSDVAGAKVAGRVPERLYSCHTAFVNGYVIEGHVPAADIQRMLTDKPKIAGLAVAGMPIGSPGMEIGERRDAFDVVAFNRDGSTKVYAKH